MENCSKPLRHLRQYILCSCMHYMCTYYIRHYVHRNTAATLAFWKEQPMQWLWINVQQIWKYRVTCFWPAKYLQSCTVYNIKTNRKLFTELIKTNKLSKKNRVNVEINLCYTENIWKAKSLSAIAKSRESCHRVNQCIIKTTNFWAKAPI